MQPLPQIDTKTLFLLLKGDSKTCDESEFNKRKVVYYNGSSNNIFGKSYKIAIDKNKNGKIEVSEGAPQEVMARVAVWSEDNEGNLLVSWD